ncbi:heterokaryon incompatibility protein-domain-containing protein [Lophiotrema nucula]|uniref:Heterokaryon incompatibility protein-domain-containing protein n=1 Tax=Lophiotrema nucula TaxID=690887 RepID=A0A6A5Z581_9PLEO|nr:heterokaryon incompatibility protein-domain-containing protein [Lophiotrema nucula]
MMTLHWSHVFVRDYSASFIRHRPFNHTPASPESLQQIQSWISECLISHGHGQSKDQWSPFTPTRLLHIQSEGSGYMLYLTDAKKLSENVSYTALSYCWGGDQSHKLTMANVADAHRLKFATLPRTLQDAIRVTCGLGYEYLWVDSLCIIQDDAHEMAREIALMPQIYSHASITIAARASPSVLQGFLEHRFTGDVIEVPFQGSDSGLLGRVCMTEKNLGDCNWLDTRAWALQESALSTRVIDYHSRHTFFGCVLTHGSTQRAGRKGHTDGWDDLSIYPGTEIRDLGVPYQDLTTTEAMVYWHDVVTNYARRQLTVPTDRILAISAIAGQLGVKRPHDTYIAGLWESVLPLDLLWIAVPDVELPSYPRPHNYQGPSWSWTGIDGPIQFTHRLREFGIHSSYRNDEAYTADAELLGHDVTLQVEEAPFGAVSSAILTLKGRLRPIHQLHKYRSNSHDSFANWGDPLWTCEEIHSSESCQFSDDIHRELAIRCDTADFEEEIDAMPIFLFHIVDPGPKKPSPFEPPESEPLTDSGEIYAPGWGLLLKKENGDTLLGKYSRLGTFRTRFSAPVCWDCARNYLDGFEQQVIQLV